MLRSINSLMKVDPHPVLEKVLVDSEYVLNAFDWVLKKFSEKPVRWIIIGEAPISYDKYIYNPVNDKDSSFLRYSDVKKVLQKKGIKLTINNKLELIEILVNYGVLILDLYPLPLDSKYYRDPSFFHPSELKCYWTFVFSKINPLVNKNTKLAARYKKFVFPPKPKSPTKHQRVFKDFENEFSEYFNSSSGGNGNICIGGNNMPIDLTQFDKLF